MGIQQTDIRQAHDIGFRNPAGTRGLLLVVEDDRHIAALVKTYPARADASRSGLRPRTISLRELVGETIELGRQHLEGTGLPAGVFSVAPLTLAAGALLAPDVGGALAHPASPHLCALARLLAERQGAIDRGPILPLISDPSPHALLRRTLLEKTVSIDTTAAGGNTTLLTMPD